MPIFDQGYQHWSGTLSGYAWRWLPITRRGVKTALRSRFVRIALLFAWLPAILLVFALCMWGLIERQSALIDSLKPFLTSLLGRPILEGPRDYRVQIWTIAFHYFLYWELGFAMILVLLVGPNLISQDLRYNALPLYFSRPLRRFDYFFGKLGVLTALIAAIIIVPSIVAYVFGLLFSLDLTIIRDTSRILFASIVYGLVIALSAGSLMLALSSLSRNSRYVALFWMGIWILTSIVSAILMSVEQEQRFHQTQMRSFYRSSDEYFNSEIDAAKSDWRPLISYMSNLRRIGEHLLGTNAAWESLAELSPRGQRGRILIQIMSNRYPWYWSAGVLIGVLALSAIILHFSIKSLDRLK
jgi:ABC-2 type transport system permease protein